jgi:hypothetical protein
MLLGTILRRLEDEESAAVALEALGDIVLLADVQAIGAVHGESPGAYASGATRRFAAAASDEDWLALMTAIENGDDPARITLERMVRWSIARDRADLAGPPGGCGGGCTCGEPRGDHAHP